MEARLKWSKIILAAKTILFHFRRRSMSKLNWNILQFFKIILFYFMMEPSLKFKKN